MIIKYYNSQSCQEEIRFCFNILGIKVSISQQDLNFKHLIYKIIKFFGGSKNANNFYLRTYVKEALKSVNREEIKKETDIDDKIFIWSMWWQDDIPEIIQMCLDTIIKFYPNLTIITQKNYANYIEIPEYILKKFEQGIIPPPHFSDYIRVNLLEKYGGIWIDASCYLVKYIPYYILKQDFFIFLNFKNEGFSNYFIRSKKNNRLIKLLKLCLEEYWKKENSAINYFFFYNFFAILTETDNECRSIYNNILPDLWERTKLITFFSQKTDFNQDIWNYLKETGFLYKIARKTKSANDEHSFVQHLLNEWKSSKTN